MPRQLPPALAQPCLLLSLEAPHGPALLPTLHAGNAPDFSESFCEGDSSSPLVLESSTGQAAQDVVVGIVSWSIGWCTNGTGALQRGGQGNACHALLAVRAALACLLATCISLFRLENHASCLPNLQPW